MVLRLALLMPMLLLAGVAHAERLTTRDAFERLDELLELRQNDGLLDPGSVRPIILVSAQPRYDVSKGWFEARAAKTLIRAFGNGAVRVCEACMLPRAELIEGRLVQTSGPVSLGDVVRLDDRYRGTSERARTAAWIDETSSGVSIRITDLRTGGAVFSQNIDPLLREYAGTARSFKLSQELERRTRGDTLTHAIFDIGLFPGQHIDLEWVDQWGDTNANLSGIVFTFWDPLAGLGFAYHRALEWRNVLLGGQVVLSVPTVIAQAQTDSDIEIVDPFLTGVGVMRFPFGSSNYAAFLSVSTNGQIALGISLLNTSLLPVLP